MRHRLAALLAAALSASTLAVLTSTQPAGAADVCVGAGDASIGGAGLFYPVLGTTTTTSGTGGGSLRLYTLPRSEAFSFNSSIAGACVSGAPGLTASGLVSGWCGHSWGSGATSTGDRFAWVSAGGFLLLTGGLAGIVHATPNALAGQSCATGALSFIVAGGAVITNCSLFKNKTDLLLITTGDPVPWNLTDLWGTWVHFGISGGNYHIWSKICIGT